MNHSRYELDSDDGIQSVSEQWCVFARDNGAEHLADGVVGTPICEWVAGAEVQDLYQLAVGEGLSLVPKAPTQGVSMLKSGQGKKRRPG